MGPYFFILIAFFFVLLAVIGMVLGIQGRKSENKLFATIGIILSGVGLIITMGFVSFILAFVPISL